MEQVDGIHRWSPRQIADAWIAKWADGTGLDETDPIPDLDHDFELMRHPTIVLDAIVEVVNAVDDDPDDKYFAVLAAGPSRTYSFLVTFGESSVLLRSDKRGYFFPDPDWSIVRFSECNASGYSAWTLYDKP